MYAQKKKRRLKRPFKVLFAILIILIIIAVGLTLYRYVGPGGREYGGIETDVETSDPGLQEADPIAKEKEQGSYELKTEPFTFTVLDVDQGQSLFIDYGSMEVLIDGGYPEYGQAVVEKIQDKVDDELDYVIATHSDADHVGGLSAVYHAFPVGKTIYGDLSTTSEASRIFAEDAQLASLSFEEDKDMTIDLGKDATLTIYDVADNQEDVNDNSVITLVQYGETSFSHPAMRERMWSENCGSNYTHVLSW